MKIPYFVWEFKEGKQTHKQVSRHILCILSLLSFIKERCLEIFIL